MRSCPGLVDDSDAAAEASDGTHGGPADVVAWCHLIRSCVTSGAAAGARSEMIDEPFQFTMLR